MARPPAPRAVDAAGRHQAVGRSAGGVEVTGWPDSDEALTAREAQLREWIAARGLTANGAATYAYYNDPWTPGFLRRNEVIISLAP